MFHRLIQVSAIMMVIVFPFAGAAVENIHDAFNPGTTAFILATHAMAKPTEQVDNIIREAARQVPNAKIFTLDVQDPANADLVREHRLVGAPMPLILVVVSGIITGGTPADRASTESLLKMLPSPKQLEALQVMRAGKALFMVIEKNGLGAGQAPPSDIRQASEAASERMQGQAVVIQINMDDPQEKSFLTQLQVDLTASAPMMIVTNNRGQITNRFTSPVSVDDLVQAAAAVPKGYSCSPGCTH